MERRKFLGQTIVGGFALSMTPFILASPSPPPNPTAKSCVDRVPHPQFTQKPTRRDKWRVDEIEAAWRRAAVAGRPLLLLIVPVDNLERYKRGGAWGEAVTHGPDALIEALLAAELATATEEEIQRFLPDYAPRTPSPILVRIDPCAIPATWAAEQAALPDASDFPQKKEDALISARIEAIYEATLAALSSAPRAQDTSSAAIQHRRAEPIPGSRWGWSGGCGADYENPDPLQEEPRWGMDCGMGHVNQRSARFLDFLTSQVER